MTSMDYIKFSKNENQESTSGSGEEVQLSGSGEEVQFSGSGEEVQFSGSGEGVQPSGSASTGVRIDTGAFIESLPIMGKGMACIFIVTIVIIAVTALLNWATKPPKKKDDKE